MAILVVGTPYDVHMGTFLQYLTASDPSIQVDLMSIVERKEGVTTPSTVRSIHFKERNFPSWAYKLPGIQNVLSAWDFRKSFKRHIKSHYSVINVRYISVENAFCYRLYRKASEVMLLTPYGSDILRAPHYILCLLRPLMRRSDYITGPGTKLGLAVKERFHIDDSRFVNLYIGARVIDEIKNTRLTREDAKRSLGLQGMITVTVGYNASVNQNHLKVIESLASLPDSIKDKMVILLPFTYPINEGYVSSVKSKLEELGLRYRAFEQFLSLEEMVTLRMCSDFFINAQSTDASSASLKEYMLSNNVVLNARWLEYPLMCKNGSPFLVFNSYEEIPEKICRAIEKTDDYKLDPSVRAQLVQEGWEYLINGWVVFFNKYESIMAKEY